MGPLQANCYLVYDRAEGRGIVIDPGGEPETVASSIVVSGVEIDGIFITHGHHDHVAGAAELAKETGADILGSMEVDALLTELSKFQLFPGLPEVKKASLDRVLTGGEELKLGNITVKAVATPGHSPGSLSYFVEGALFTGDLLFHGSVGRTDLPGGSFGELARSIKELVDTFPPETIIYPGHGNTSTLIEEKENNIFLEDIDW